MAHRRFFKWLLISVSLATSCGASQPTSTTKSWLGPEDAQAAFEAADRAVPYLPFGYIVDGCYARAYYMAMEAAADFLPVSVQYIYMPTGSISPDGVTLWGYHAATMIWVDGDDEPSIADPAFFSAPVARDDWLVRLQPTDPPAMKFAAGSNLGFFSDMASFGPSAPDQLVTRISAMPAFGAADITAACSIMSNYIGIEPGLSSEQKIKKTARLIGRTKELVATLASMSLVTSADTISASPESCY
jgi:hypothetical protein